MWRKRREDALFLEGTYSLSAEFHGDFFPVQHESLGLKIRAPDFFGMALREADIASVLFAFAG